LSLWESFTDPETKVFRTADSDNLVILAYAVFDFFTLLPIAQKVCQ